MASVPVDNRLCSSSCGRSDILAKAPGGVTALWESARGKCQIEDKRIGLRTNIKVNQRICSTTARIEAALQFSRSRSREFKNRRSIRRCFHIRYKRNA